MAGNVWEWCEDWWEGEAYQRYARGDLTPPASGAKASRGGSWDDVVAADFRCADRISDLPAYRDISIGFRCARGLP